MFWSAQSMVVPVNIWCTSTFVHCTCQKPDSFFGQNCTNWAQSSPMNQIILFLKVFRSMLYGRPIQFYSLMAMMYDVISDVQTWLDGVVGISNLLYLNILAPLPPPPPPLVLGQPPLWMCCSLWKKSNMLVVEKAS